MSDYDALNYNPYTGEYLFQIPELITAQQNSFHIKLQSAVIPRSWYDINATNNNLALLLNSNQSIAINIPIGNYDGKSLCQTIQNMINNSNLTVSFNSINSKISFYYNLPISILGTTSYFLMKMMGFIPTQNSLGIYDLSLNKYIVTSNYPIDLSPISHICISTPDIDMNNYVLTQSYFRNNFLHCVPVNVAPMNKIIFENQTDNLIDSEKSNLQVFRVKLTDQYGIPIDFNGINWHITLLFHSVRFVE